MAIGAPTLTLVAPSFFRILAMIPSSCASTAIVALSVSTSNNKSPDANSAPSLTCHATTPPSSMVGDMAGIPKKEACFLNSVLWKAVHSKYAYQRQLIFTFISSSCLWSLPV
ncbi:unnamed protein product [Ambrosiozyma monospora]|uniref:Unnamed protein product n=1 Tax=Ambrosiozyma monospora TaxID=43982 RepID=A0A9W6T5Q4_AMBMO|nr:unnamed protein product [Ambrosiozyma monospora]